MYGSNTFSNFYEYIYTFLNFSFVPWSIGTCCLRVRPRLPLPSPTSLVSNRLVASFFMAHPLARGFLNSASSIVPPYIHFLSSNKPFYGKLLPVSVSPPHCLYWCGFIPVFNEISSWRTCICDQFNILWEKLAPGVSKSSAEYHMTSEHLSWKNENLCSHKKICIQIS